MRCFDSSRPILGFIHPLFSPATPKYHKQTTQTIIATTTTIIITTAATMKLTAFLILGTALAPLTTASPCSGNPKCKFPAPPGHEWHPPVPGRDSRSPCPGLNILANHGYLPRSGLNISLPVLRSAVKEAFNFAPEPFDVAFKMAVDFQFTTTGDPDTWNLHDLNTHDTIEFDGSLSWSDYALGNNHDFDPAIWRTVAERLDLYSYRKKGGKKSLADTHVTVESVARARALRVKDAMAANPHFNRTAVDGGASIATTALFMTTLWDDEAGAVPKAWAESFFERERMPWCEGYRKPEQERLGSMIQDLSERIGAVPVDV